MNSSGKSLGVVFSRTHEGLVAPQVRVEVHLGPGLPAFNIVGLAQTVVRESKERVRAALATCGFQFPSGRITVNLAPADLPKHGGRFDLPIAIGILAASGRIAVAALARREFYGELSLGGELRAVSKLLPALVAGAQAGHELIVPASNLREANALKAAVPETVVKLAMHLRGVCDALMGLGELPSPSHARSLATTRAVCGAPDLADVRGQYVAKRALEIAAAGGHGLIMIGPPGAGKTMLAQRLVGLLPPLSPAESLEVGCLMSAAGLRPPAQARRPFRQPAHTASVAALIGGSAVHRPGELSLAHQGVLFLDELPEFAKDALEALREPMESGVVLLSRAKRVIEFPALFQLVAAMNPCPCGHLGQSRRHCRCTASQVVAYRGRISGPLLDRIDMHLELEAVPPENLVGGEARPEEPNGRSLWTERSVVVAARVAAARAIQWQRQGGLNARLSPREIESVCRIDPPIRSLLSRAIVRLALSARAYHHVLKLARSIADLAGEPVILEIHVAEAIGLRALDRAQDLDPAPTRPSRDYLSSDTR